MSPRAEPACGRRLRDARVAGVAALSDVSAHRRDVCTLNVRKYARASDTVRGYGGAGASRRRCRRAAAAGGLTQAVADGPAAPNTVVPARPCEDLRVRRSAVTDGAPGVALRYRQTATPRPIGGAFLASEAAPAGQGGGLPDPLGHRSPPCRPARARRGSRRRRAARPRPPESPPCRCAATGPGPPCPRSRHRRQHVHQRRLPLRPSHTSSSASAVNACPVSAVCWP